jgi:putative DNA primase/helicase
MLTILGGSPGCGKTTIALSLAATVTRGGTWPDGSRCSRPGDVLVWSGEDAHAVTAARLKASGADMSRIHFIDGVTGYEGEAFDPGRDMPLLESTAEGLPCVRLLILDPIVSAVAGDSHKGAEVRRSLQPVVAMGQRIGCAVLGITHFSKGTGGRDPVERVTGSIAFAALARLVLVAAKVKAEPGEDGESRRVLMRAKSNIGPDDGGFAYALERVEVAPEVEGQRVRWLEALQGTARELLTEAEAEPENEDGTTAAGVEGFLRALLMDGPMPAKAIRGDADGAGYAWRTVQQAAHRMGVERRKDGMKGGWVWALGADSHGRRRNEGAEGATQKVHAPSAPSASSFASSAATSDATGDDGEVF